NDVPGVIGEVGKILGDNKINIADFRLSRGKEGALAVILLDEKPSSEVIKKLDNLEAAIAVAYAEI
ncbi:MAG: ACT domain-containing protein, partial [Arcobacter sp.]|nr:ACT domain-containing protein [Arcobacter sp.]